MRALASAAAFALLALADRAQDLRIRPHPIVTQERLELTRSYCRKHYGLDSSELKPPQIAVIHAAEIATLADTLKTFEPDFIDPSRSYLRRFDRLNVGVHFVVDRDGEVYSLLPLDVIGRHAIGFNHLSVGIENVGSSVDLTPQQLEADAALVQDLVRKLPSLRFLIGHHEYVDKSLPHYGLFKELAPGYRPTQKSDPGPAFMRALREKLAQRGVALEPHPVKTGTPAEDASRARRLCEAALAQTRVETTYDPSYVNLAYPGGDVPMNRGVCTDVLIRAYRRLGVDLQVEVHEDMKAAFSAYPKKWGRRKPDSNIDHRRVPNLMTFFSRQGASLPLSQEPADYQAGDIVAWDLGGGVTHIGLVVDRKSGDGSRFLIAHNIGRGPQLEDVLFSWKIIGHYRYKLSG